MKKSVPKRILGKAMNLELFRYILQLGNLLEGGSLLGFITSVCSCPHTYCSKPSPSTAAGQESSQIVPKGWRSCGTLRTPTLEKHTEVTVDTEYAVQCPDFGMLLEDLKGKFSILGTRHVTSPAWHG